MLQQINVCMCVCVCVCARVRVHAFSEPNNGQNLRVTFPAEPKSKADARNSQVYLPH